MKINKKIVCILSVLSVVIVIAGVSFFAISKKNKDNNIDSCRKATKDDILKINNIGSYASEGSVDEVSLGESFVEDVVTIGSSSNEVYEVDDENILEDNVKDVADILHMKDVVKIENESSDVYSNADGVLINHSDCKELVYCKNDDNSEYNSMDELLESNSFGKIDLSKMKKDYSKQLDLFIDAFDLKKKCDKKDMDVFVCEYMEYEDQNGKYCRVPSEVEIRCNIAMDTDISCIGNVPSISFSVAPDGSISNLRFVDYSLKKMDVEYDIKDTSEIVSDIKEGNNVLVSNLEEANAKIVLDEMELVLYADGGGIEQDYMIPHYLVKAHNAQNDNELSIIMPAIKNEYLEVK